MDVGNVKDISGAVGAVGAIIAGVGYLVWYFFHRNAHPPACVQVTNADTDKNKKKK